MNTRIESHVCKTGVGPGSSPTSSCVNRRNRRSRRGSAMILVITAIVFLLLVGLSMVTITGHQSVAANAGAKASQIDDAVELAVGHVTKQVNADLQDMFRAKVLSADREELAKRSITVPHPVYHRFLASQEPDDAATWATWSQISNVIGSGTIATDYINTRYMLEPGNAAIPVTETQGAVTDQTLPFLDVATLTTSQAYEYADPDGDNHVDSRWFKIPIPSNDGWQYVAAVRIVDSSGKINLNTGTVFNNDVKGITPGDISSHDVLRLADGSVGTWGTAFTPAIVLGDYNTAGTNWQNFLLNRGLDPNPTAAMRLQNWNRLGSYLGYYLGVNANKPTTFLPPTKYPVTWSDEAELTLKNSIGSAGRSALEQAIDGTPGSFSANGPFRSYYPGPTTVTPAMLRADRRRQFTAYNSDRIMRAWIRDSDADSIADTNEVEYRRPTPYWLTNMAGVSTFTGLCDSAGASPYIGLNALFPLYFTTTTDNFDRTLQASIPTYRLNPVLNTGTGLLGDSRAKFGYAFETLLRQNGDAYTFPSGYDAAYGLAANLHTYQTGSTTVTDTARYDPTPSAVVSPHGKCYFGVKLQPFFREVSTMVVYQDRANGAGSGSPTDYRSDLGGDNDLAIQFNATGAQSEYVAAYMMVDVGNPFPGESIDLTHFYLRINGSADVVPLGTGTLAGDGRLVLYPSKGLDAAHVGVPAGELNPDGELVTMLNSTVGAANIHPIVTDTTAGTYYPQFIFAPGTAAGALTVELIYAPAVTGTASAGGGVALAATDKYVVVDKIGETKGSWTAAQRPAAAANQSVTTDGYRFIISKSIMRDERKPSQVSPALIPALVEGFPYFIFADDPSAAAATAGSNIEKVVTMPVGDCDGNWPTTLTGLQSIAKIFGQVSATTGSWDDATTPLAVPSSTSNPRFSIRLNIKNAPIETVGEVASVLTAAHVTNGTTWTPVSSALGTLLAQTTPIAGIADEEIGYLHVVHANLRTDHPRIPVSATIFDILDVPPPGGYHEFKTYGYLNLQTATREAMEGLPYLIPDVSGIPSSGNYYAAGGIYAYRQKISLLTSPAGDCDLSTRNNTGITNLRSGEVSDDRNIVSLGELLAVRKTAAIVDSRYTLDYPGHDTTNNNPAATSAPLFFLDTAVDDTAERTSVFRRITGTVTTRSDTFTVHLVVKAMKPDPQYMGTTTTPRRYLDAGTRRCVFVVDRAMDYASGNDIMPTVPTATLSTNMNTITSSMKGAAVYLHYRGNDPTLVNGTYKLSQAYSGVIASVPTASSFTLDTTTLKDLGTGNPVATVGEPNTDPFGAPQPPLAAYTYFILAQPKIVMFAQDR